jgi:hypothetical protein
MALPKIQTPVFDIVIPSLNKAIEFRPFIVKEEKILLMAQQSTDQRDIVRAIKQIITNCCLDTSISVNQFTTTDLEYVFLKLRAKSVNNIIAIEYTDEEDGKMYKFDVDLDEVNVTKPKDVNNNIKINDDIGIIMCYPSAAIIDQIETFKDEVEILNFFIKKCIVEIYDEENVYPANEHTDQELQDFIDGMDVMSFDKIREYLDSAPKLNHVIKYTNSLGNEKEFVMDNLRDFFILR